MIKIIIMLKKALFGAWKSFYWHAYASFYSLMINFNEKIKLIVNNLVETSLLCSV